MTLIVVEIDFECLKSLDQTLASLIEATYKRAIFPMNNIHYFETSAINVFADELKDFEFNQMVQKAMRIDFCISPVTLWEILLNTNDTRRERLIYWVQFNCAGYLLKSPAEILVNFLRAGAPNKDRKTFWLNRETGLPIAETWRKLHQRLDRTIPIDLNALLERTSSLRELSRMYKDLLHSMTDSNEHGHDGELFHKMMLKLRQVLGVPAEQMRQSDKLTKTSLILAFFFLCVGIDLDNSPVCEYWQSVGIDDPVVRLEYLVSEIPMAIVRGPLIEMALMMNAQAEMGSKSRGALFDALHTIYCYYADNTISNDPHFTRLKDHTGVEFYDGIISADKYVELMKTIYGKLIVK